MKMIITIATCKNGKVAQRTITGTAKKVETLRSQGYIVTINGNTARATKWIS